MSGFIKSFVYKTTFDGDNIEVTIDSMKRADLIALTPFMDNEGNNIQITVKPENQMQFMDVAARILEKRIKSFQGLTDADGNHLTFEDIADENYFLNLISEFLQVLIERSTLKKEEVKNLEGQPDVP